MRDACTIRRVTGYTSDGLGGRTPTYSTIYAGRCRFQQEKAQAQQHDAGEDYILLVRRELQVPVSVTGVLVSDEVTVDSSADPDLTGRVFLVRDLAGKTDLSSRRFGITERTD